MTNFSFEFFMKFSQKMPLNFLYTMVLISVETTDKDGFISEE